MKDDILRLRAEGKTYTEIQTSLGCSKSTISYYCGVGQKEKVAERNRDKRSSVIKHIQEVKAATPCADCGENYPYWMKQFDHLGDNVFNISSYRQHRMSLEQVKKEIAKCDIVCANCHANRTHMRIVKTGGDTLEFVPSD